VGAFNCEPRGQLLRLATVLIGDAFSTRLSYRNAEQFDKIGKFSFSEAFKRLKLLSKIMTRKINFH
jgi:hypothetical protein